MTVTGVSAGYADSSIEFLAAFDEVWAVDFEFIAHDGEAPIPICLTAIELKTNRLVRQWLDEFGATPPYRTDARALFVAYYASAEIGCHLALGWPIPERVLDLFTEFRNLTNGLMGGDGKQVKAGLLDALAWFRLPSLDAAEKQVMRALIASGLELERHRERILDYCESDVIALRDLLPAMGREIDLPRALLRGRSMAAAARIEHAGVPLDAGLLGRLQRDWNGIQDRLIAEVDRHFGVYDGRVFKQERFEAFLQREGIRWPRSPNGELRRDDDTFKEMSRLHPKLDPLRQLRKTLSTLKNNKLAAGADGRSRVMLSAFASKTGRNQPSTSRFIFGQPSWMRATLQPSPGRAIAYLDWSQQEFGIAAALSGDEAMKEAYGSGDPYLNFAIQVGAAPPGATKHTHQVVRDQFKAVVLAVQYQMTAQGLSLRLGCSTHEAERLLHLHRQAFSRFWRWSDAVEHYALLYSEIETVFGWRLRIVPGGNLRTIRNFPMQANGAEMLRLACCMATEQGISVVAPVHDALMIEDSADAIDATVARTQAIMAEASRIVLDGFELVSDAKIVRWPDRYLDARGAEMFNCVMRLLNDVDEAPAADRAAA